MCGPHGKTQLAVLWIKGDRATAETLVFKYIRSAKANGWWRGISLLVLGPSVSLLAGDKDLQDRTRELTQAGVDVKAGADEAQASGSSETLRALGVDVQELSEGLTEILQDENEDWAILTV
jgi:hypothetical protein